MFKKLKENAGFTLAELLIVVAIIGVLVAISIPVFSGQLEKAREATDAANLRAAYAEVLTNALNGETGEGKLTKTVVMTQKDEGWTTMPTDASIGDIKFAQIQSTGTVTVTATTDGKVTFGTVTAGGGGTSGTSDPSGADQN